MFGLVKEFRSATNKILVDYNRFKKWVYSNLTSRRRKEQRQMKFWSRKESLEKMLNKSRQADTASAVESKFERSLKSGGRLTEDLLTEVRSYVRTNSQSPIHARPKSSIGDCQTALTPTGNQPRKIVYSKQRP